MVDSAALLARLIEAGTPLALVGEVAAALARAEAEARSAIEAAALPSKGALRTRRWRERHQSSQSVTCDARDADVTESVTAPPTPNKSPPDPQKLTPTPCVCVPHEREADPISVPITSRIMANRLALATLAAMAAGQREAAALDGAVAAWNDMAKRTGLSAVVKLTAERKGRLRARLAEFGPDAFTEAIAAIERSPFCRGDSDRGWRADFDFLLQPKSFTRLIEGSYDRQTSQHRPRRPANDEPCNPMVRAAAAAIARGGGG
ncbi:hypothetical protein PQ455_01545 [Sphingomonas naphthae]|uniref:Uncharacterized protein n=1 Tax=Sphingomonas naphthae TaxID=1813468 RepID=A0ABY7TQ15_9SPHN|nr:hypothetical protein [Sphingomonas naphthae]WCT73944.1 hypothetical protein PQ455_01545 [Sphingomonas naphthae]